MRAKYINKTARRRSIRPDGDHYREMRKLRGDPRARNRAIILGAMILLAVGLIWVIYALFIR